MLSENLPSLARLGLIQHLDDQGGFVDLREFRMDGNRRIIPWHQSHKGNPIPADRAPWSAFIDSPRPLLVRQRPSEYN